MTGETNGHKGSRALELIDGLVDAGTWTAWNDTPDDIPQHVDTDELRRAATRSGTDESVITGRAEIAGEPVTLIVSEFAFLGGSIGRVAGHRIATAIRRATADGLPVVGLPCSGGTRMQEGTPAFLEMAAITGAVVDHRAAGLPYLVYLRHPTTGGVFASWGSLGHVTWAEPDALVGFLGPRVVEGLTGEPIADGVQRAENLLRHGLIDDVVPADELRDRLAGLVTILMSAIRESADSPAPQQIPSTGPAALGTPLSAWDAITATRHPGRPGVRELLPEDAVIIADHGPIVLALSRFGVRTALVIGQDADRQRTGEFIGPEHLRMVRRGLALARDLRIAVVTVIDTPGARLSASAEEGGIAGEIARCTAELIALPAPTVSVLLGQGGGGAALSLFPADRRIATVDSWLSPLPPEGASLIVHRDIEHAAEMAAQQHVLSVDLARRSVIDTIVDAPSPSSMPGIRAAIGAALDGIARPSPAARTRVPVAPRIPAVGAIVRDDAGRFLLVQRAHEPQAGLWTVPGGKVEPGESLQQAVIREIAEETGIVIEVLDEAWVVDIPDGMGAVFEVHDFVATPLTTDVTAADDAADAGWFTTEQMRELPLTPGLITYLDRHGLMD
ncbi:carboxyl transferase domain-containing protein [Gordonia sp. NPDC003504]